ncbi:MAG: hypothetical protein CVT95_05625 [Bacteroidetes bacterium HGW-Bacteroidetes-12]|nr:MAG: hypothetical protein CVT95_05625 [Bacteroidetes bacterium HGW-Bacteroidetes-12]
MENLKLGIESDDGDFKDFFFDNFIIDGLFFTSDIKKINDNCKNFKIKIDKSRVAPIISKIENIAIITFYVDNENQAQYFVGNDLNLNELNRLPETELKFEDKILVIEAYCLF